MLLFQYFYQIVSPLAEVIFVMALLGGYQVRAMLFYLFFIALDYLVCLLPSGSKKNLHGRYISYGWQRVAYRMLMWLVVVKSVYSAVNGMLMFLE